MQDHVLILGNASCAHQAKINSNIHALLLCICFPLALKYPVILMLEIIFEENLNNTDFPFELCIHTSAIG